MALVKCPDCEKRVSSRAFQCPFCGCPAEFFEPINKSEYESKGEIKDESAVSVSEKLELAHEDSINEGSKAGHLENKEEQIEENISPEGEGIQYCNQCGAQIDADAAFCNQCGATVSVIVADQIKTAEPETVTKTEENETSENKEKQIEENISPEGEGIQYCNQCGAQIDADAAFCNQCGAKISPLESGQVGNVYKPANIKIRKDFSPIFRDEETDYVSRKDVTPVFRDENPDISIRSYKGDKTNFCRRCGKKLLNTNSTLCNKCSSVSPSSRLVL